MEEKGRIGKRKKREISKEDKRSREIRGGKNERGRGRGYWSQFKNTFLPWEKMRERWRMMERNAGKRKNEKEEEEGGQERKGTA